MSEYYAVIRSTNHLAHYGVKGMKWGVRKAIEKGGDIGKKKLAKQYAKATKKLKKLKKNADVLYNLEGRKQNAAIAAAGLIPAAAGIGVPIMAKKSNYKLGTDDKVSAGFNALSGIGMIGAGTYGSIMSAKRSKAKGHDKAVKKVNEWQKEMKKAFKGTKYYNTEKNRPEYNDMYTLYEYGSLKPDKGKPIPYRTPTVSIKGSSLVRDRNDMGKSIFKKRMTDAPVTQKMSDSKVMLVVHSPSGNAYPASEVDRLIKVKQKKRRK